MPFLMLFKLLKMVGVSSMASVARTYVGMLERCEKNVTIYNIERIADALGVEPFTLLREETPKKRAK